MCTDGPPSVFEISEVFHYAIKTCLLLLSAAILLTKRSVPIPYIKSRVNQENTVFGFSERECVHKETFIILTHKKYDKNLLMSRKSFDWF